MAQKRSILIIRTSALGDVAMCIPAVYSLAKQYPDLEIKMLTRPFFTRLFINPPANLSFIEVDWKGRHKGIKGIVRLLKELSAYRFNYVADLHNVLRSWLIDTYFFLRGTSVRMLDKQRSKRKNLLLVKEKGDWQRSYIQRYADVFHQLNLSVKLDFTSIFTPDDIKNVSLPILQGHTDSHLIGIAPFARYYTKIYPLALMEKVIAYLNDKGYRLFLFGSPGKEEEQLKKWEQKYASCLALPGLLTIEQELLLMAQLDVMLTMDSANMHLASLVHTPVVSIWGGTTPAGGFLGWQQREENALCAYLSCQPCSIGGKKACPLQHFDCMNTILPEEICKRIERNLSLKNKQYD